ncbi:MAG: VCBS repeat-containing protein [Sphingomonadales bacterium]|nr:VCBS repeat-containing protein [Sphingomonadaceae bacterium]MBS3932319.1 VCBS repeat-containing protein [Sphingomonadales bacterium]
MKLTTSIFVLAGSLLAATPALAASDMFLKFEGVDGEAAVAGWSFGACNAGQCATITAPRDVASGQASGKTKNPPRASWDLATSKGARSAGGVNVAVGDLDGDGRADLAYAGTLDQVTGLSLTFKDAAHILIKACGGKHIPKAVLKIGADTYELTDTTVTCTSTADAGARKIDQTPARISTNMTVPKQTQGATFGEKVQGGMASAGALTVTFTGGQMKHTKSGHVTLLK